jgi:hypothetical protein
MSDLGALKYYLGIEVQQTASGITVSLGAYADKILERAGMLNYQWPVGATMSSWFQRQ